MILIDKKIIEEIKLLQNYIRGFSEKELDIIQKAEDGYILSVFDDLLSHSKEVEVLDIDEEMGDYCKHYIELTFVDYCKRFGYKLIKIIE